jgi:hypothetical protein
VLNDFEPGREPINSGALANVRFGAHSGFKSDIAQGPKSADCCKTLFGSLKTNFPGYGRGDRMIVWGTTATSGELTGNFSSALEDTSIGDRHLFRLFATN